MNPLAVLIPERIDIEEIVNVNSSLFEEDYLRYLINTIVIKQGRMIEDRQLENENNLSKRQYYSTSEKYVKIESLKKGKEYSKHKYLCEYLCQNNVEVKRSRTTTKLVSIFERIQYVTGQNSFEYRFGTYFRKSKLKLEFINDQKIIKAIIEEGSRCDGELNSGTFNFLSKFFNQDKLQIDLAKAVDLCELRYDGHKKYDVYVKELVQIVNLYNGIYRLSFKRDSLGRVYTNITQLPKVYRRFITYNNKRLSEMDISNSVIFFMGVLLNNTLNKDSVKELFNKNIYNILKGDSSILYLMFYQSFKNLSQKEIQLLIKLGRNGKFYNEFISYFDEIFSPEDMRSFYESENDDKYTGTKEQIRKVCKKRLLAMLFAQSTQFLKEQEIFKLKFPDLLEKINKFKDKAGHKIFSHILFQIEACFVVDVVARRFNRKYRRNAPIFTLHDCLITTSDYVDRLQEEFKDCFIEYLNCFPKTKIEEWDD
ncbi:hypothetical protein [Chryseobacterium culicis]|uniref:hypothetical protein n=1 Tax=Chryseobacterium culicis TaxID=680127 RepID=UPI001876C7F4|nr:hypothetical protein [Chryseobacterium culicis]MBE4950882.1 hypothetical protein [Chryseobacterium culicis]